jgi:hypothetical protein
MNRHLRKLAIGEWGPGEFRHHLRQTGTPLVERAGPGEVAVTFVDEPADADSTVHLRLLIGYNTIEPELEPVAGTPFRAVTLRMRSDLRFSYAFARHRPSGAPELVRDPFNPPPRLTDPRLQDALAVLPDAAPLPWLDAAATRPAPALEAATLASEVLGNERRIWISASPGTAAQPLVIVFDGTAGHSAPAVRDAQSPSCWYHPDLPGPAEPGPLLRHAPPTPTLIADFAAADPAPIRIFHEAGDLEDGPPPAQIRRSFGHRWLHDVLTSNGYDTVYREFAGGHDAAWWRGTFADGLQWVFPG